MGHMYLCNAPSVNNNYLVDDYIIAFILDRIEKLIKKIKRV